MGFKARKTYLLVFAENTPLHGAEVRCRGMAGGKVAKWKSEIEATRDNETALIALAADQLARVVTSWDLEEDDGEPIAVTAENILDLELDQIMCLYDAWLTVAIGVRQELGKGSPNGSELPEGLITGTVVGSPDQPNSLSPSSSSESSNGSPAIPIPV